MTLGRDDDDSSPGDGPNGRLHGTHLRQPSQTAIPFRGPGPGGRRAPRRPLATNAENGRTSRSAVRLKRITRAILAVGFGAAAVAFIVDRQRPENPLGYDPLETKKYLHDLEVYGGKANVIAAQFREWFSGLWYGKNLAFTIAVITVFVVLVVRFFARPPFPVGVEDAERTATPRQGG